VLIYRIRNKGTDPDKGVVDTETPSKEYILKQQLNKCFMKVGDRVKFKKPKRNAIYGKIVHIEEDYEKVIWIRGGLVPANIHIECEPKGRLVKTSIKKICFVSVGV
jgi:hypothetical protein